MNVGVSFNCCGSLSCTFCFVSACFGRALGPSALCSLLNVGVSPDCYGSSVLRRKAAAERKKLLQGQFLENVERDDEKVKEEDLFGPPSEELETEVEHVKEEE